MKHGEKRPIQFWYGNLDLIKKIMTLINCEHITFISEYNFFNHDMIGKYDSGTIKNLIFTVDCHVNRDDIIYVYIPRLPEKRFL